MTIVKTEKGTQVLPCILTDDDKLELGKRLVHHSVEAAKQKANAEIAVAGFKSRIKEHQAHINEIVQTLDRGKEDRRVDVEYRHDLNRLVVETMRLDTGEIVQTRTMNAEEREEARQPKLPGTTEAPGPCTCGHAPELHGKDGCNLVSMGGACACKWDGKPVPAATVNDSAPLTATVGELAGDMQTTAPKPDRPGRKGGRKKKAEVPHDGKDRALTSEPHPSPDVEASSPRPEDVEMHLVIDGEPVTGANAVFIEHGISPRDIPLEDEADEPMQEAAPVVAEAVYGVPEAVHEFTTDPDSDDDEPMSEGV